MEKFLLSDYIMEKASGILQESRVKSVSYWEKRCENSLQGMLIKGDLVILYNCTLEIQLRKLFSNQWNLPFLVVSQLLGDSYQLEELEGTPLKQKVEATHIKVSMHRALCL